MNPALITVAVSTVTAATLLWLTVRITRETLASAGSVPARYAVPLDAAPRARDLVFWPLQIASLAVFALAFAAFAALEPHLPARIALHYDALGNVDRMGSPGELYVLAWLPVIMLALPWLIAWSVAKERWALPPEAATEYAALELERRRLLVRLGEWLALDLVLGFCGFWLAIGWPGWGHALGLGCILVSVCPGLLLVVILNLRALRRIEAKRRLLAGSAALGTRARGWKWDGLVYFSREDPALVIPKHIGVGSTLNFARPAAWLLLGGLLLIPLALAWLMG